MPGMSEPRARPRWQPALLLIGGTVFLLGLLAVATWERMAFQVHERTRALTAEFHTLSATSWPRPSHVTAPTPGTFVQGLEALGPELASFKGDEGVAESGECLDVIQGRRPVSELSSPCRKQLETHRALLGRLLRLSRTETLGHPTASQPLSHARASWDEVRELLYLAALETRLQAEGAQSDAAVETCLDALALARDLGAVGTYSLELSLRATGWLFLPCQTALARASSPRVRAASDALRHLREGWSPLSLVLQRSTVGHHLGYACVIFSPEERARLPEPYRACLKPRPSCQPHLDRQAWWFRNHTFLRGLENDTQGIAVVDLPSAQRVPRLAALTQLRRSSWNPMLSWYRDDHGEFADKADLQRAQMDLLLALTWVRAYRAEHGEWPQALPALYAEGSVLRPTRLSLQPGTEDTLEVLVDDVDLAPIPAGVRASVPLRVTARP